MVSFAEASLFSISAAPVVRPTALGTEHSVLNGVPTYLLVFAGTHVPNHRGMARLSLPGLPIHSHEEELYQCWF